MRCSGWSFIRRAALTLRAGRWRAEDSLFCFIPGATTTPRSQKQASWGPRFRPRLQVVASLRDWGWGRTYAPGPFDSFRFAESLRQAKGLGRTFGIWFFSGLPQIKTAEGRRCGKMARRKHRVRLLTWQKER